MRAVPVLVVDSPVKGLLLVNGQMACEVDGPASLPLSSSGDIYLLFVPYGDYAPVAQKLSFLHGTLLTQDSPNPVTLWPDGVVELSLLPRRTGPAAPGREVASVELGDSLIRLVKAGGYALYGEDAESGEEHLNIALPEASGGLLRLLEEPFPMAVALLEEGGLQRLILISEQNGAPECLLDVSGTEIHIDRSSSQVRVRTDLMDVAGHSRLCTYALDPQGEGPQEEQMAWQNGRPESPRDGQGRVLALAQALALGLTAEARGYLDPVYAGGLTDEELTVFFGMFDAVAPVRYGPAEPLGAQTLALLTHTAHNVAVARIYAFELGEGGITAISQYSGA